jgi:TatD DNase family protein
MPRDRSYPPAPDTLLVPVVDNHTHIEPAQTVAQDPLTLDEQIDLAWAAGVDRIVQCGCDLGSARWTADVAVTRPEVLGAIAIHPNEAPRLTIKGAYAYEGALGEIATLAARTERIRAIGETGLDYYRTPEEGWNIQKRAFRDHIALAKELGRALQIHDRDAHQDILDILEQDGAPDRTVFHCFSGDAEMARHLAERGWYASFAGNVTYNANEHLREALRVMPASLVLVETDAPYLTPVPFRGRPNAPFMVPYTVRAMAQVLEAEVTEFCTQISANSRAVYGSW